MLPRPSDWFARVSRPSDICLAQAHSTFSYEAVDRLIVANADLLRQKGWSGAIVGLICDRSPVTVIALWSLLEAQISVLPIPAGQLGATDTALFKKAACAGCLVPPNTIPPLGNSYSIQISAEGRIKCDFAPSFTINYPPSLLIPTSGTTGVSHIAAIRLENAVNNAVAHLESLILSEPETVLVVLPLHFSYTLVAQLIAHAMRGDCLILYDGKVFFPAGFVRQAARYHASLAYIVPSIARLLGTYPYLRQTFPSTLKTVCCGGDRWDSDEIHSFRQGLPHLNLVTTYGLTEAGPRVTTCDLSKHPGRDGWAGWPLRGIRLKVINAEGRAAGPMEPGELCVATPYRMAGYVGESTPSTAFSAEWLKTGDLGAIDRDGCLKLFGRNKSVINCGGIKICPEELELVLCRHEWISAARIVGYPHPLLGEALRAEIQLRNCAGKNAQQVIKKWIRTQLASDARPHQVVIVDSVPRTSSAKIRRS